MPCFAPESADYMCCPSIIMINALFTVIHERCVRCDLSHGRHVCTCQPRIFLTIEYLKLGPGDLLEVTQFQSIQGKHPVFPSQDQDSVATRSTPLTQKEENKDSGRE